MWENPPQMKLLDADRGLLPASWRLELPIFEGPLDLLLRLVKVNEIEITDIPVALVCDQFHEYLQLMDELDLDIAAEYVHEAALLVRLKAGMLLPRPPLVEDEQEDPRRDLIERLLEHQKLKEAAQTLAEVDELRHGLWTRGALNLPAADGDDGADLDLGDVSLFDLLQAFRNVLRRYDEEHPKPLIYEGETFSVRGQVERLLQRFETVGAVDLQDDLFALTSRSEAIACFLAVLEMARLSLIRLHSSGDDRVLLFRTTRPLDPILLDEMSS